ncbi:MAG: DUF819 family protein [Acidobacteria bacterium]|nr:DUF819 family protein [Acidobacteriota bacterium]
MGPLIPATNTWGLLAVLLAAGAFGLWAEKTPWGARLSGAVVAIGTTFILSNLGVIPASSPVYDMVWAYLVPLAIPLLLFKADLRRILREAGPTLLAFLAGAVGTVVGTVVAYHLIPLGEEGWKVAGIFCATYVGGSMNYVAVAEALGLRSADLVAAGMAADNLVMTLYFLLLFALPGIVWLRRRYHNRVEEAEGDAGSYWEGRSVSLLDLAISLAVAAVSCALGYGLASWMGWKGGGILVLTALVVVAATLAPGRLGSLGGAEEMGTLLMQVFFAAIGASANIGVVLRVGPILVLFAATILLVHLVIILAAGRLMGLDLIEVVIASNANMGGPTTAAAMAVARRWETLVIPAILCGTLGYATATFIGVAVAHWLR